MSTPKLSTGKSWFRYFQYQEGRDSPGDARNVILVVVALIAAVTFQAGVNPPGGVWQDTKDGKNDSVAGTAIYASQEITFHVFLISNDSHVAGTAIYASQEIPFYVFLISNTVALSTAILVIVSLTYRFPFHFEIWIATGAMLVTYGSAVFAVTPHDKSDKSDSFRFRYILLVAALPFLVRGLIHLYSKLCTKPKEIPNNTNEC